MPGSDGSIFPQLLALRAYLLTNLVAENRGMAERPPRLTGAGFRSYTD